MTSRQCKRNRIIAWVNQRGKCYWCLRPVAFEEATHEHIIPASDGGPNNYHNTAMACRTCNDVRGRIHDEIQKIVNAEVNRDTNLQEILTRYSR